MSQVFDTTRLDAAGLNLHAVFDLAALPEDLRAPLAAHDPCYRQLILLGHGGPRLWEAVQASGIDSANPIDDFTLRTVGEWAAGQLAGQAWAALYPAHDSVRPIGLQALGRLAGWHHDSPFMIGINERWGSWFAYRAVIVAASGFAPTAPMAGDSPCRRCAVPACVTACPGRAMDSGVFDLGSCLSWRRAAGSSCARTCLARLACPVAAGLRYPGAQIAHSCGESLRMIGGAGG